jgi:hypothetical protein
MVRLSHTAGQHDVSTFRKGIGKDKLEFSNLVACQLRPGEIISLDVDLNA